jgi:flagellar motility protein MotE (MotC chaperone)
VRKYFHENRDKMQAKDDVMRASLDNIAAAITAQPFDANALNEAFSEQRAHIVTMTENAQQAFVAIIASMTDKERAEYVDNVKEQRHKWRKDHLRKPKD